MEILNKDNKINSIQISKMGDIPEGEFSLGDGTLFLIKNKTEDTITASIKMADSADFIETTLYSGWNVELVKAIKNVQPNTLQYGY